MSGILNAMGVRDSILGGEDFKPEKPKMESSPPGRVSFGAAVAACAGATAWAPCQRDLGV